MTLVLTSVVSRLRGYTTLTALALVAAAPVVFAQTSAGASGLTLRALLDSVRASHPTVRAAESRIRAAEGSRTTARTFGNPMLNFQIDHAPFPVGGSASGMEREVMTTATVPLEGFYQRKPRIARANAEVRAAEADAAAIRQRIGLDAATAYYRVAIAQVQVATTRDLVNWLDTLVTYNRARFTEGIAAEADLIRAELELDRMAAEAAMQSAELAQARAALAAYLPDTKAPGELPVVAAGELPLTPPPRGAETLSSTSVAARPDVRAARERVTATTEGVATERSMFLRQLGATIGTMQTGGSTSMVAGVSLPAPLFDRNRGEIERANAERDAATFELAAQERMATADQRGAREAARILTDRAVVLARRDSTGFLARAEESRRIALGAYREGAVPLFQVIDAARSWADARMTYHRTLFAQHHSILTLIVAEGQDLFAIASASVAPGGASR